MPFDAAFGVEEPDAPIRAGASARRRDRGRRAYLGGLAAEAQVEDHYTRCGARTLARRWRGGGGEIDLILQHGAQIRFVEVKSSDTCEQALWHMTEGQMQRVAAAASSYLATTPAGLDQEMQLDLALVDRMGRVEIIENLTQG